MYRDTDIPPHFVVQLRIRHLAAYLRNLLSLQLHLKRKVDAPLLVTKASHSCTV